MPFLYGAKYKIGAGFTVDTGGPSAWTPGSIDGCVLYSVPTAERYDAGGGATDYDMNDAALTDALWVGATGVTASKAGGGYPGDATGRYLSLLGDGATANAHETLAPNISIGQRMHAKGWARAASGAAAPVWSFYGGPVESMTADGVWRDMHTSQFARGFTTTSVNALCQITGTTTDVNDFDQLDMTWLSYDAIHDDVGAGSFVQTTVADMPFYEIDEINGRPSIVQDGGDYATHTALAGSITSWSVMVVFRGRADATEYLMPFATAALADWIAFKPGVDYITADNGGHAIDSASTSKGDWHSVLVTYDHATTTKTLYLDGVSQGTDVAPLGAISGKVIGLLSDPAATYSTTPGSAVAELGIYNRALTSTEAADIASFHAANYATGVQTACGFPDLEMWYGFKDLVPTDTFSHYSYSNVYGFAEKGVWHEADEIMLRSYGTTLAELRSGGLRFNGDVNTQYLSERPASDYDFVIQGDSTVGVYANFRDTTTGQIWLSTNFNGNPANSGFRFEVSGGEIKARYTDGAGVSIIASFGVVSTGRHSIIATFDASAGVLRTYLDKTLIETRTNAAFASATTAPSTLAVGSSSTTYGIRDWTFKNIAFYSSIIADIAGLHKALRRH